MTHFMPYDKQFGLSEYELKEGHIVNDADIPPVPEDRKGFKPVLKYNPDNKTFKYVYKEDFENGPTLDDVIEENLRLKNEIDEAKSAIAETNIMLMNIMASTTELPMSNMPPLMPDEMTPELDFSDLIPKMPKE